MGIKKQLFIGFILVVISLALPQLSHNNNPTLDNDTVISNNTYIYNPILVYYDDDFFIIKDNTTSNIVFYSSEGLYIKSYSLSSYSYTYIYYEENTIYGMFERGNHSFYIENDGIIHYSEDEFTIIKDSTEKCMLYLEQEFCIKNTIFNNLELQNITTGSVIDLDNNNIYRLLSIIGLSIVVVYNIVILIRHMYIIKKRKIK